MFAFTPVSALHSGYPACPSYNYESAIDVAVQRAAYDYAVARARAEAARRQRLQEEEARRRFELAVRREQAARRAQAQAAEWIQQHFSRDLFEDRFTPMPSEGYQYRRRFELEVAQRQAEAARRRQEVEVEQARAAAVARQRAEAQRLEREHWMAILAAHFGGTTTNEKAEATSAPSTSSVPGPSKSEPKDLRSELLQRSQEEEDREVLETLDSLLSHLGISAAPVADRKGKARETPAIPFNFSSQPKAQPEVAPSKPTPTVASSEAKANSQPDVLGANLHRTPAMAPSEAKERLMLLHNRKLSLGAIKRIEDNLRELQTSFVFPADLDLNLPRPSSPTGSGWDSDTETDLAFTSKNKPVHVYEHALNGLLTKLDAVDSFGDEQIRGRRKEVVNRVEEALKDVAQRVEESRERERSSVQDVQPPLEESEVATTQSQDAPVRIPIVDAQEKVEEETAELTEIPLAHPSPDDAAAQVSETSSDAVELLSPLLNIPIPSHDEQSLDLTIAPTEAEPTDSAITMISPNERSADAEDILTQESQPVAETLLPVQDVVDLSTTAEGAQLVSEHTVNNTPSPASVGSTPLPSDTTPGTTPNSIEPEAPVAAEVFSAPAAVTEASQVPESTVAPTVEPTPAASLDASLDASQTPESPSTPSPSSSPALDAASESFLLQSSPLPDPEPRKHAELLQQDDGEADADLDVIDSEDAREVLNEAEEWSDLESA